MSTANVIGDVRRVWDGDPRVAGQKRVRPIDFRLRDDGVQVFGTDVEVWVEHRRQCPSWSGATRDDTSTYASGVTVYDTATGDFWTSNQAVSAGQSPTSHPAKWDRVEFPEVLAEYVARSVYYALTNKEQALPESFTAQDTAGWPILAVEIERIERQQGQARQLNVRTGKR